MFSKLSLVVTAVVAATQVSGVAVWGELQRTLTVATKLIGL